MEEGRGQHLYQKTICTTFRARSGSDWDLIGPTYTFFAKSAVLLKKYADLKGATYTFFMKIVSLLKFSLITFVI